MFKNHMFNKIAQEERKRLREKLKSVEPGTEEYEKILKQLKEFEEIEAKRRDGRVKPLDWFKFLTGLGITGIALGADFLIPAAMQKLKLTEFAAKLIK